DPGRDWHRHEPFPLPPPPCLLGQGLSGQQRVGRQATLRLRRQGQSLAALHPGRMRLVRHPQKGQLLQGPIPSAGRQAGPETRPCSLSATACLPSSTTCCATEFSTKTLAPTTSTNVTAPSSPARPSAAWSASATVPPSAT